MAYTKTNWQNGVTQVNATNLNHIEQGIYDNSAGIGNLSNLETTEKTNLVGALNETINNIGGTILWTNPNPTDAFASQTITLSSSDYDMLEIFFIDYQYTERMMSLKFIKGENALLNSLFSTSNNSSLYFGERPIDYTNGTTLTVGDCKKIIDNNSIITPANANNWIIPQYVVGYKTGLFS